jgi:hypothetical protein
MTEGTFLAQLRGNAATAAIADPDHFPDLSTLTDALQVELALLTNETVDSSQPAN